jgi:hypothetical protein
MGKPTYLKATIARKAPLRVQPQIRDLWVSAVKLAVQFNDDILKRGEAKTTRSCAAEIATSPE